MKGGLARVGYQDMVGAADLIWATVKGINKVPLVFMHFVKLEI